MQIRVLPLFLDLKKTTNKSTPFLLKAIMFLSLSFIFPLQKHIEYTGLEVGCKAF